MSMPGDARAASVKRNASAPISPISSSGSTTLPLDLLILRPWASRTSDVTYTDRNGTSCRKRRPSIIMRATQKKMMSWAVMSSVVG